jgi:hypothetical protein
MKILKVVSIALLVLLASSTLASATAKTSNQIILTKIGCSTFGLSRIFCNSGQLDWVRVSNYLCRNVVDCTRRSVRTARGMPSGYYIQAGWVWDDCTPNRWTNKATFERREDGQYIKKMKSKTKYF